MGACSLYRTYGQGLVGGSVMGGPENIFNQDFGSQLKGITGNSVMSGGLNQLGSAAGVGQYLGGMAAMPDYIWKQKLEMHL